MSKHCAPEDRKIKVLDKIETEDSMEHVATSDSRVITAELLHNKGYTPEDLERDIVFPITVGETTDNCKVDYIIKLEGKRFMAIKCAMAIDSRERHVLAIARCVNEPYAIPFAAVSDGLIAHVLNTMNGKLIASSTDGIPTRDEALKMLDTITFEPLPAQKREKEMRVLQAFEVANSTIHFGQKNNSTKAVKSNFTIPKEAK